MRLTFRLVDLLDGVYIPVISALWEAEARSAWAIHEVLGQPDPIIQKSLLHHTKM